MLGKTNPGTGTLILRPYAFRFWTRFCSVTAPSSEGNRAALVWFERALAWAVDSSASWIRAFPSGDVAISTARRRLSCRTGRSAAWSAANIAKGRLKPTQARMPVLLRRLHMTYSCCDGRAESGGGEIDQAAERAFYIGGVA